MRKNIVVGGFTQEQREKQLEKIKEKFANNKAYKFIEYVEGGALKSVAVFEVDEKYLRKEKMKNLFLLSGFFLACSVYMFIKAS